MRIYIYCTISAAFIFLACPASWGFDQARLHKLTDAELKNTIRIYACSEPELDLLLPELHRRYPSFIERVATLAQLYLGAPYVTDPLTHEQTDWFPYKAPNCTMLVLYIEALANSRSLVQAREHMRRMHYRGGMIAFRNRYHFTEDRITDPANHYFAEATRQCVRDPAKLRQVTLELNRRKDGSLLFGDRLGPWTKKLTLGYIPRAGFSPPLVAGLGPVMGVAFVKKENWERGLLVGHEGLLIKGDLYHCSLKHGVVVEKSYLAGKFSESAWEGLLLFRLLDQQEPLAAPSR